MARLFKSALCSATVLLGAVIQLLGATIQAQVAATRKTGFASLIRLRPAMPQDAALLKEWDEKPHVKANAGDEEYNGWNWDESLQEEADWRRRRQQSASSMDVPYRQSFIAVLAHKDSDGSLQQQPRQDESSVERAVGFVQILDPTNDPEQYWGSDCPSDSRAIDIWIGRQDCLSKGYGTEMMKQALQMCFDDNHVSRVLVDPMAHNERGHVFYQRLGFEPQGIRWFGPDECLVHALSRAKWMEHCRTEPQQDTQ